MDTMLVPPWERLLATLQTMQGAVVAFSGGVDSTLVVRAAREVLGGRVLAVTGISDTYPPGERAAARQVAANLGVQHLELETRELEQDEFSQNSARRCYYCKQELFTQLWEVARDRGYSHVLDGSNWDDLQDWRPGREAAADQGVTSPLFLARITKQEVRQLARHMALSNWDKPAMPCLSSRFPYGTPITATALQQVAAAEAVIAALGIGEFRVRHHDSVARLEVPVEALEEVLAQRHQVVQALKNLGYNYISLDLEGFRSGSMNEGLPGRVTGGP